MGALFRGNVRETASGIGFSPSGILPSSRGAFLSTIATRTPASVHKMSDHHRRGNHRTHQGEGRTGDPPDDARQHERGNDTDERKGR